MKKSELNKLKAIRRKLDKYANEINALSNIIAKYEHSTQTTEMRWARIGLDESVYHLCEAQNEIIDFIRDYQPDYLQTNYNL